MLGNLFSLKYLSYLYVICVIALSNVTASVGALQRICLGITTSSFAMLFAMYVIKAKFFQIPKGLLLIFFFTIYVWLSSVFTEFEFSSITQFLMLVSCFIFSSIYKNREDYIGLLKAIILGNLIMICLLIYMAGSLNGFLSIVSDDELSNLFIQKNIVAFSMSIGAIVSLYLMLFQKNRIYIISLILFIFILFCTGSRRGLISMLFGTAGLFYFNKKVNKTNITKLILVLIITSIALLFLLRLDFFSSMNDRLTNLIFGINDKNQLSTSDEERFLMIKKAIQMFKEKPILGHGAGAFKAISGFDIYSHNNYVELLSNYGIIGFCLFYGFIFKILITAYSWIRNRKDVFAIFIVVFIVVRLISDIGNVSYYDKFLYVIFGVTISYFKYIKNEKRCL